MAGREGSMAQVDSPEVLALRGGLYQCISDTQTCFVFSLGRRDSRGMDKM